MKQSKTLDIGTQDSGRIEVSEGFGEGIQPVNGCCQYGLEGHGDGQAVPLRLGPEGIGETRRCLLRYVNCVVAAVETQVVIGGAVKLGRTGVPDRVSQYRRPFAAGQLVAPSGFLGAAPLLVFGHVTPMLCQGGGELRIPRIQVDRDPVEVGNVCRVRSGVDRLHAR